MHGFLLLLIIFIDNDVIQIGYEDVVAFQLVFFVQTVETFVNLFPLLFQTGFEECFASPHVPTFLVDGKFYVDYDVFAIVIFQSYFTKINISVFTGSDWCFRFVIRKLRVVVIIV